MNNGKNHENLKERLDASERKFRNLFENIPHGAFFTSREGRFLDCNQAMVDMLGYRDKQDLMQIDITKDLYADPQSRVRMVRSVDRQGYTSDYETVFKKKNQDRITVLLTVHGMRDQEGGIVGYQGLAHDITERRRIEKQLLQAEKMANLGRLAAGVAHEINNPLGGIHVYAHLVLEKMPPDSPLRGNIEKIIRESSRCKNIVRDLLNFSRQTEPLFIPTSVNQVLEKVLGLFEDQALFHDIRIVRALDPQLPSVIADSPQLQQVFTNIIFNAAEALEGTGTIRLHTEPSADGQSVRVDIEDDGPGIPEKLLGQVFEPFFTTKSPRSPDSGTGLGLAISYGIVENHGGTIQVASELGKGTRFSVSLPLRPGKSRAR